MINTLEITGNYGITLGIFARSIAICNGAQALAENSGLQGIAEMAKVKAYIIIDSGKPWEPTWANKHGENFRKIRTSWEDHRSLEHDHHDRISWWYHTKQEKTPYRGSLGLRQWSPGCDKYQQWQACDKNKVDVRVYTCELIKIYSRGTAAGQKSNNSSFNRIISWAASRISGVIVISDYVHSFLNPKESKSRVWPVVWILNNIRTVFMVSNIKKVCLSTNHGSYIVYRVCPETGDRWRASSRFSFFQCFAVRPCKRTPAMLGMVRGGDKGVLIGCTKMKVELLLQTAEKQRRMGKWHWT